MQAVARRPCLDVVQRRVLCSELHPTPAVQLPHLSLAPIICTEAAWMRLASTRLTGMSSSTRASPARNANWTCTGGRAGRHTQGGRQG